MKLPSLSSMFIAEVTKLFRRSISQVSLVVLAGVSVLIVLGLVGLNAAMEPPEGAAGAAAMSAWDVSHGLQYILSFRNFFLFRGLIIAVVVVSFAGEFVDKTLRESLLRPVPRWKVLLAKWGAVQVFVFTGVLLPFLIVGPLGRVLLGAPVDGLSQVIRTYLLSWAGDLGFATFVMLFAILVRSVAGTIIGLVLYWFTELAINGALLGLELGRPMLEAGAGPAGLSPQLVLAMDAAQAIRPWLPSSAVNLQWNGEAVKALGIGEASFTSVLSAGLSFEGVTALLVLTSLSYVLANVIFNRIDVP